MVMNTQQKIEKALEIYYQEVMNVDTEQEFIDCDDPKILCERMNKFGLVSEQLKSKNQIPNTDFLFVLDPDNVCNTKEEISVIYDTIEEYQEWHEIEEYIIVLDLKV